ncbi:UNVERIFIED_ORG: hypothetical protein J2Y78_004153 [Buttiauxella agrestis ATCC 33320]
MDNQDRNLVKKMLQAMPLEGYVQSREARAVADQLGIAHAFVHEGGRRKKTYSVTAIPPCCDSWYGWHFKFNTLHEANSFAEMVRTGDRIPNEYDGCDLIGCIGPRHRIRISGLWSENTAHNSYWVLVAPTFIAWWVMLSDWMGEWWPVGGLLLITWLLVYWDMNHGLPKSTWWLLICGALAGGLGQA